MKNDVFVVIPARNEEKHIAGVIKGVRRFCGNIVVVDDGSTDRTLDIARKNKVTALHHITNLGKGASVNTGCQYALDKGAKKIVLIDSDGQHDPKEITKFLKLLKDHDIVFGVRRFNKDMPFILRFGNLFITKTVEKLFKVKVFDTQCGYRAFTAEAYRKVKWKARDYSMESEMIANTGKSNLKYAEVSIRTIYSDKYKGTTVLDGVKIVFDMIWWKVVR
jgi:glycosyltransferase involved in cell wall biosynthesis